jgi:hypothetical protein
MSPQGFESEVRRRAAPGFSHMVVFTDHARAQMVERRVTRTMALRVLQRGSIDGRRLRRDEAHGNWAAPIVGITAGVEIEVICALPPATETAIVVTVIRRGRDDD